MDRFRSNSREDWLLFIQKVIKILLNSYQNPWSDEYISTISTDIDTSDSELWSDKPLDFIRCLWRFTLNHFTALYSLTTGKFCYFRNFNIEETSSLPQKFSKGYDYVLFGRTFIIWCDLTE